MRGIGSLHPTEGIEIQPDFQVRFLMVAGTGQAFDYPSNTKFMRLTGVTTANLPLHFFTQLNSTGAAVSSGSATAVSTNVHQLVNGDRMFQVPSPSTGFSVVAQTSGYVVADFWSLAT
jgi:hypothetical protein